MSGSVTVVLVSPGLMVAVLSTILLPGLAETSGLADSDDSLGAAIMGWGFASGAGVTVMAEAVGVGMTGCCWLRTS